MPISTPNENKTATTTGEQAPTNRARHAGISWRGAAIATGVLSGTTRLTAADEPSETRTDATQETIETTTITQEAQIATQDTETTTTTDGEALPSNRIVHVSTTWTATVRSATDVPSHTTLPKTNDVKEQAKSF